MYGKLPTYWVWAECYIATSDKWGKTEFVTIAKVHDKNQAEREALFCATDSRVVWRNGKAQCGYYGGW